MNTVVVQCMHRMHECADDTSVEADVGVALAPSSQSTVTLAGFGARRSQTEILQGDILCIQVNEGVEGVHSRVVYIQPAQR